MSTTARRYHAAGRAGCVQLRTCRQTGTAVGVYRNDQAGLDDDGGDAPWSTVCEPHGTIVHHRTLRLARGHATDPRGWCDACRDAMDAHHGAQDGHGDDTPRTYPVPERLDDHRDQAARHADYPCVRCGRRVVNGWWVVLVNGGGEILRADLDADPDDPGFVGGYPLGPECARHVPAAYRTAMDGVT